MTSGPTQGAVEPHEGEWQASPVTAIGIRVMAAVVPFVTAWFVVATLTDSFYRPGGLFGVALWLTQSLVTGISVAMTTERFTRKTLPLASLFNMTLVFPDQAPSRFGVALRSGTLHNLESRSATLTSVDTDASPAGAASQAVELIAAISRHDRMTRGHSERVRAYSDLIAEELGLTTTERGLLAWGAVLHDLGKVSVSSETLNKESRLTDQEWGELQAHPAAAVGLLEPLQDWLGEWLLAAPQHHERWDGAGYPLGLAATDISLAGRIVAVADAYDVITSRRCYKKAMGPEAAREELIRCAGSQFDPDVVRAFLNVSLHRRWAPGPVAAIAELPRFAKISANLPAASAMIAGAVVTIGSVGMLSPIERDQPANLAFAGATIESVPEAVVLSEAEEEPASLTTTVTVATDSSPAPTTVEVAMPEEPATSGSSVPDSVPPSVVRAATAAADNETTTTTAAGPTTTVTETVAKAGTKETTEGTTSIPSGGLMAKANAFTIEEGKDIQIYVLNNDASDLDLDTFEIVTDPQHAQSFRVHEDHIHYKSEDYTGTDSLEYRICDGNALCATTILTIAITD